MRAPAAPFPWREVMAFGLGRLCWTPDAFWAASPREILAAVEAHRPAEAGEPPSRTTLDALMRAHPDPASRNDE
ncbi:phage tail assembly chaperone [Bosea sp. CCNWLW174]|uniref:phage tail assembly chaperone n=1 Tax=unclassified Bosea (in: a-proteobacteria) TaxID=2653178 RepID=UPI0030157A9D